MNDYHNTIIDPTNASEAQLNTLLECLFEVLSEQKNSAQTKSA